MAATRVDGVFAAGRLPARPDPRADADLLSRFLDQRDDAAFEALVARHTPALRAVARAWLREAADVDDAVQATFLVLVRRAAAIRSRAALGAWLCRVAENVARRLKGQAARTTPLDHDPPSRAAPADDGVREAVTREVARLPEKYRRPVQLCYLGGLTTAQAAERLGWPRGTVLTRLDRAKKRLRRRLAARGAALSALAAAAATRAPALNPWRVWGTARAARGLLTGAAPADLGLSDRALSLTEGVVHAMVWNKLKALAALTLLAAAVLGFGLGRWATAAPAAGERNEPAPAAPGAAKPAGPVGARDREVPPPAAGKEPAIKSDEARPAVPGRRREAVIRLPVGTFVKEVDVPPHGAGRVTWTYEEDRVLGVIEGSVLGAEFEIHTEAEFTLSSTGTIYGILTGAKIAHLKVPADGELGDLAEYAALWPLFEPMIAEVLTDLPFSYQFRVQGDRLVISNFRALLAGPNPLGKVGGLAAGKDGGEVLEVLSYFQALALVMEGTYTAGDAREKEQPKRKAPFSKPRGTPGSKTGARPGDKPGAAIGQVVGALAGGGRGGTSDCGAACR
jgi:RNA polymerase sigma factor (sigma-70 family)